MKTFATILLILTFTLTLLGQNKPSSTLEKKATQKIVIEKINGDRLTGLFVGGNTETITIEISEAKLPIKISEVKAIWFGDVPEKVTEKSTAPVSETNNLSVEAAIIYRSGEVVPIARTTFYLIDDDVITIFKNAGITPTPTTSRIQKDYTQAILSDIGFSAKYGTLPEYQTFIAKWTEAIKPHIKFTFETDFNGKASVPNIPLGNYYLFAISSTRQSGIVWNMPVDTNTTKKLVLDAKNAAFAY
ncbi:MAG TPA: hypothetical protein PKY82_23760 [Pyrinomonadaceae bacterium]|nr:hypothetical protein [Pyrinomonadaceae bacterium]